MHIQGHQVSTKSAALKGELSVDLQKSSDVNDVIPNFPWVSVSETGKFRQNDPK